MNIRVFVLKIECFLKRYCFNSGVMDHRNSLYHAEMLFSDTDH